MADLGAFLEKDFDPKAYINSICGNKPADQALDRSGASYFFELLSIFACDHCSILLIFGSLASQSAPFS